jgi:hypothetical protein
VARVHRKRRTRGTAIDGRREMPCGTAVARSPGVKRLAALALVVASLALARPASADEDVDARRKAQLIAIGGAVFGVTYGTAAAIGAASGESRWFVPVLGPTLAFGHRVGQLVAQCRPPTPQPDSWEGCRIDPRIAWLTPAGILVIEWDLFQAAGLGVLAYGVTVPAKKKPTIVPILGARTVGVAGTF